MGKYYIITDKSDIGREKRKVVLSSSFMSLLSAPCCSRCPVEVTLLKDTGQFHQACDGVDHHLDMIFREDDSRREYGPKKIINIDN